MKKLFVLVSNGGDGSYYPHFTFNEEWIERQHEAYDLDELEYDSLGCDGDGFQRVDITKNLDGGRVGFVSDLERNFSCSGLFNGKTDIVEMIGVSVRFCTLAESLRGTFEAAGTEVIQCDHRSSADYFNIGFENVLFSRNIADRDLIVSQVLSGCGHINDPGFGIIDRCTGGERSHGAYHGCG